MKKISVFLLALLSCAVTYAQHNVNSFFDDMGLVRLETQELKEASDTLVTVFHRSDDVVWSRVVYRIIDMRQGTHLPQVWAWLSCKKLSDISTGHRPGGEAAIRRSISL